MLAFDAFEIRNLKILMLEQCELLLNSSVFTCNIIYSIMLILEIVTYKYRISEDIALSQEYQRVTPYCVVEYLNMINILLCTYYRKNISSRL